MHIGAKGAKTSSTCMMKGFLSILLCTGTANVASTSADSNVANVHGRFNKRKSDFSLRLYRPRHRKLISVSMLLISLRPIQNATRSTEKLFLP